MAFLDDQMLDWLKRAATAIAGGILGVLAMRRQLAKDNSEIGRRRADDKVQTSLMEAVQHERDEAVHRLQDMIDAREKQFGACEERVRSLSEQVLDLRLANGRLQQELTKHDPAAAERLLVQQVRPEDAGKGDEPP